MLSYNDNGHRDYISKAFNTYPTKLPTSKIARLQFRRQCLKGKEAIISKCF